MHSACIPCMHIPTRAASVGNCLYSYTLDLLIAFMYIVITYSYSSNFPASKYYVCIVIYHLKICTSCLANYIHFGVDISVAWAGNSVAWAKASASPGEATCTTAYIRGAATSI